MNITINNPEKAKLRFYVAYAASLVLALTLFALLWKDKPVSMPPVAAAQAAPVAEDRYIKIADFLHSLLKEQEGLYTTALKGEGAELARLPLALQAAQARLDSVMKSTPAGAEGTSAGFRRLYDDVQHLLHSRNKSVQEALLTRRQANQPSAPIRQTTPDGSADLQRQWSQTVQEKERQIAALQKQVQDERADKQRRTSELQNQLAKIQQNAAGGKAAGEGEWKQKYNTMKARHSELNTAYNTLSRAYQNVVADNRKLYNHIKSSQN